MKLFSCVLLEISDAFFCLAIFKVSIHSAIAGCLVFFAHLPVGRRCLKIYHCLGDNFSLPAPFLLKTILSASARSSDHYGGTGIFLRHGSGVWWVCPSVGQ